MKIYWYGVAVALLMALVTNIMAFGEITVGQLLVVVIFSLFSWIEVVALSLLWVFNLLLYEGTLPILNIVIWSA